jgi:TorA maturation chaperone TorD
MSAAPLEAGIHHGLARAGVYRVLSQALAPPTPLRLAEVRAAAEAAAAGETLDAGVRQRLGLLAGAAADADPRTLAEEHVFLFDRQVRCPPYEGAYGDGPQLAGKAATLADVSGFYAAFGLGAEDGHGEAEDHIVAELEFMSALALKEAWALAEDENERREVTREAQLGFLRDHLGRWAVTFAGELAAATPLPYYAAVADILREWMAAEVRALDAAPRVLPRLTGRDPLQDDVFTCPMVEPAPEGEVGPST